MKKILFLISLMLILSGCSLQKTVSFNFSNNNRAQPLSNEVVQENKNENETEVDKVKIVAVGDIMTSRVVGQKMKQKGYNYPFNKTKEIISEADLAFANLETAITPGKEVKTGEMMFRADPESVVAMKTAGFDIVSLANNHTPNYGQQGLLDTFKYLNDNEIKFIGAGENMASARELKITEVKGVKIGWLAYNADDVVPPSYQATDKKAGTVFLNIEAMKTDVSEAKVKVDLVFVSMHAGTEYTEVPNAMQADFAHAAVDAGADLVIGHHPHVVQHLEKYKDKFIIYSLGNFIFDQMWSVPTRQGLMVEILADKQQVAQLKFIPIMIDDYSQPRVATEKEAEAILKSLAYKLDEGNMARQNALSPMSK